MGLRPSLQVRFELPESVANGILDKAEAASERSIAFAEFLKDEDAHDLVLAKWRHITS